MDRRRDLAAERHLDEDERLVDQGRVEKREAAAVVRVEPAAQIVPALDLVYGFVLDDLFEDGGWTRPGHALEHQESPVEPGTEQMHEVPVHACKTGIHALQQVLAHVDQCRRSAGCQVQPAQKLLPGRLDRHGQPLQRLGAGLFQIRFGGFGSIGRAGHEPAGQEGEDRVLARRVSLLVAVQDAPSQRHARRLAAARRQPLAEAFEAFLPASGDQRGQIEDLTATLRNLREDFLEK